MTIYQAGIYAALRIDTDEQNKNHLEEWKKKWQAKN